MKVQTATGYECPECQKFNKARSLGKGKRAWLCPAAGDDVTLEAPKKTPGILCPHCGAFIAGGTAPEADDDARWTCEHCEDEPGEDEHEEVRIWVMPECECNVQEVPEKVKRYRCGECEDDDGWVEDRDEARDCCKD